MPKSVRIEGNFLRHTSLALVNRELALGLEDCGWEVSIRETSPFLELDSDAEPRAKRLYKMMESTKTPDIIVRHAYPCDVATPEEAIPLAIIQPWEMGSMPQDWRRAWTAIADKV